MQLIGLTGYKTAGKDTVASLFKEHLKYLDPSLNVQSRAIADPLKDLIAHSLDIERQHLEEFKAGGFVDVQIANHPHSGNRFLTGRQVLQNIGNGAREVFHQDFWLDQTLPEVEELDQYDQWAGVDVAVVTDVRYANEAERVLWHGGEVWLVDRTGLDSDGHISETPLPESLISKVIENHGTTLDLSKTVQQEAERLHQKVW